jgi:hypothetical protein
MKNPLIVYAVARVGIFVGILTILLLIGIDPILATVFSTMIAFSISLIFLRRPREASSARIHESLKKPAKTKDEQAED